VSVFQHRFGHSSRVLKSWRARVRSALQAGAHSPFYVFAAQPLVETLADFEGPPQRRPWRWWLSAKTQPLPALWRWWRSRGGIEVVSEFEFRGAQAVGYEADQILVNGPAKHRWLPAVDFPGGRVNFDSPRELAALLPRARSQNWRVGLRVRTPDEVDSEHPEWATQFGFEPDEIAPALRHLARQGLVAETLHFHLRTNLPDVSTVERALQAVVALCRQTGWSPRFLDVGGGLPPAHTTDHAGNRFDRGFSRAAYAQALDRAVRALPTVEEVWLEHGRSLSAGAGVLVVRVLDVKERLGRRLLICDGGRTLNALVSVWEEHELLVLESRRGRRVPTAVHGPTCMAFDCLGRRLLPASVRPGDHLLWFEAGAYHLPWETRFSHGLAEVWWEDESGLRRVRAAETFERFASAWEDPGRKSDRKR
jgi:diaminopimelate decarboxylase